MQVGGNQVVGSGRNNPNREYAAKFQQRGVQLVSQPVIENNGRQQFGRPLQGRGTQVPLSEQNNDRRSGVPLSEQNQRKY